jgi:hypothetical protein
MSKILTFRSKRTHGEGTDERVLDSSFLQDDSETLRFGEKPGASITLSFDKRIKDWSNQELADLFRVVRLLSSSGLSIDHTRGLTDEGDPWFVMCKPSGEVFIHICRLDGVYVLDNPSLSKPLTGRNFGELISEFSNQALKVSDASIGIGKAEHGHVFQLRRGNKVRLHPSAMLAALIWTLYLASEELTVISAEQDSLDDVQPGLPDGSTLLDVSFASAVSAQAEHQELKLLKGSDTALMDMQSLGEAGKYEASSLSKHVHIDPSLKSEQALSLHQNPYAVGLSTLAVAIGVMSTTRLGEPLKALWGAEFLSIGADDLVAFVEEIFSQDATRTVLADLFETVTGLSVSDEDIAFEERFVGEKENNILDADANLDPRTIILDLPSNFSTVATLTVKAKGDDQDTDLVLSEHDKDIQPNLISQNAGQTIIDESATNTDSTDVILDHFVLQSALDVLNFEAQEGWTGATLQRIAVKDDMFVTIFSDSHGNFSNDVQHISFLDVTQPIVITSPSVTEAVTDIGIFDTLEIFEESYLNISKPGYKSYDAQAQSFINYILAKPGIIDTILYGNELIMIDTSERDDLSDTSVAMTWEFDDGSLISLIGFQDEFQKFDLIA